MTTNKVPYGVERDWGDRSIQELEVDLATLEDRVQDTEVAIRSHDMLYERIHHLERDLAYVRMVALEKLSDRAAETEKGTG